jgi:hypothetical protein
MDENEELKQMLKNEYFKGKRDVIETLENSYWNNNKLGGSIIAMSKEQWNSFKSQMLED